MTGWKAAVVLVLAVLAGCGGGSEEASPLDRWRQKADAACDRAEKAVRESGQARDVGDLDRVMVRAGDIVLGAVDEIEALEVPEEDRATVAPVRETLGEVRESVEAVRKAVEGGDEFDIGVAAGDVRTAGNAWFKTMERAGLKRCGRRAITDAAADELTIPGFVAASADTAIRLHRQVSMLRRLLAETSTDAQRISLWKQTPGVMAFVEDVSANQVPERLDKFRFDAEPTMDLETLAEDAVYWYRRGNTTKARAKEAKFFAVQAKAEKTALKMFQAAGAAGRELLPSLRRAFGSGGDGGDSGGGSES
jgi:hypothetical protein